MSDDQQQEEMQDSKQDVQADDAGERAEDLAPTDEAGDDVTGGNRQNVRRTATLGIARSSR